MLTSLLIFFAKFFALCQMSYECLMCWYSCPKNRINTLHIPAPSSHMNAFFWWLLMCLVITYIYTLFTHGYTPTNFGSAIATSQLNWFVAQSNENCWINQLHKTSVTIYLNGECLWNVFIVLRDIRDCRQSLLPLWN